MLKVLLMWRFLSMSFPGRPLKIRHPCPALWQWAFSPGPHGCSSSARCGRWLWRVAGTDVRTGRGPPGRRPSGPGPAGRTPRGPRPTVRSHWPYLDRGEQLNTQAASFTQQLTLNVAFMSCCQNSSYQHSVNEHIFQRGLLSRELIKKIEFVLILLFPAPLGIGCFLFLYNRK